ncbi:MAG: hypothetical protein ABI878_03885 [Acidobacteriota bacterium]
MRLNMLSAILLLFLGGIVYSQTSSFSYQGKLTESSMPANGQYDFIFRLFDTSGTQIGGDLAENDVQVTTGIFTVSLDFGASPFSSGAGDSIEIAVRPGASNGAFTTLTPRQPLNSSPYAIKSASTLFADSLSSACVLCVTDANVQSISGNKIVGAVPNALNAATAANISGVVGIANGGTGSSLKDFVDLSTTQAIGGDKFFTSTLSGSGSGLTDLTPANILGGTASININGMAARSGTVTTGSVPSVTDLTMLALNYGSPTALTDLANGVNGQCVLLIAVNNKVSILDNGSFRLSANWNPSPEDTLTVCQSDALGIQLWYERARSSNFSANFALTVSKAGAGTGTVTSSVSGINCGADCSETYSDGTVVNLSSSATADSFFGGWSGEGCSGTGTCQVTMSSARNVVATFNPINASLTVTKAGSSTGTVTSNPAGINCGADCQETYSFGTVVTLTATPDPGTAFAGWTGDCIGIFTCQVTMDRAKSVTAVFNSAFALTITKNGSGTGSVLSDFFGINCGADCTENYSAGTIITLQAFPQGTSTFAGWSGGGCTGTGNCTITMDMARTVNATFNNTTFFTLTVEKLIGSSTGGTVTSQPAGINCGADCSESYLGFTVVILTAVPANGAVFSGWAGECSGTGTCQITMTQAKTISAIFNPAPGGLAPEKTNGQPDHR